MKGPFFVKNSDGFEPTEVCAECGWFGSDQTCVMQKCPFIGYSEEEEEDKD